MSHSPTPPTESVPCSATVTFVSTTPIYLGAVNLRYVIGADGEKYLAYVWETYQVISPLNLVTPNVLYAGGDK